MELHGKGRLQKAIQCESLSSMHSLRLWEATTSSVECYVPRCSSLQCLTLDMRDGEQYGGPRLELHHLRFLSLSGSIFFASEINQEPLIIAPCLQSLLLDNVDVTPGHHRLVQSLNPSELTFHNLSGFSIISRLVLGALNCAEPDAYVIEADIFDYLCDTNPPVWPKLEEIVIREEGLAEIDPEDPPQLVRLATMRDPRRLAEYAGGNDVAIATLARIVLEHDAPACLQAEITRLLTPIVS